MLLKSIILGPSYVSRMTVADIEMFSLNVFALIRKQRGADSVSYKTSECLIRVSAFKRILLRIVCISHCLY